MDRARIRWRNVARLAAGAVLAGLALALAPGLLTPSEPPPLPADVGLATGPEGVYAATGLRPARGARTTRPHDAADAASAAVPAVVATGIGPVRRRSRTVPTSVRTAAPRRRWRPRRSPRLRRRRPHRATSARRRHRSRPRRTLRPTHRPRPSRPHPPQLLRRLLRRARLRHRRIRAPPGSTPRPLNPLERRHSSASSTDIGPALERRRLASLLATRPLRGGRARLLAAGLLTAVAVVLVAAERAEAGRYVVSECSPSNPAVEASWERSSDHYRARALCGTDSGLQVFHDAEQSGLGQYGAWVWRAPAGTVFTDLQANASLTYQAGHHGELVATEPGGAQIQFGAEHNDFRVHSLNGEFSQFHVSLRCAAPGIGRPCGRAGADAAHAYVRGVFLRTEDRATPSLLITGGSVLGPQVVRGLRGLTFSAADRGSGIRKVWVEANGATLVTDIRNCDIVDGFAAALSPCPATTIEAAAVPTAGEPFVTGPENTVTACVEDLALDGFPNRACEQRTVWVDNSCPASAVGGGTSLVAGFGAGLSASAVVRSDRRAVVRGTLAGVGGEATVCALTRTVLGGAPVVVGATATTGGDGNFTIELPPGPSREVFVHYAVGDRVIARHGLLLRSAAHPSLAVRPTHGVRNHTRLHFSGRLPGPACFDRLVKVQARLGGHRWQVFRTDRADPECRFEARYRLRATRNARRYRFRALVPQQASYPFERGHSATARVKVRRPQRVR